MNLPPRLLDASKVFLGQGQLGSEISAYRNLPTVREKRHLNSIIPSIFLPVILFLGSISIFIPLKSFALTPQEIFSHSEGNVMTLEVLDEKGELRSAHTALLLSNDKAVSQCNLLTGAAFQLRQGNKTFPAKTIQKDIARNLCVLQVSGGASTVTPRISVADPQTGSRVYAISNALGLGISISEGVVSGIRQTNGHVYIQFTAPIAPGSEGGGLFDEEGCLIGLINYRQRDGQNVNFALPARWILEIEQRSASSDAVDSWRAKSNKLENEQKWRELAEVASKWAESLTDNVEAWLCLAYAREKLKDWPSVEQVYREVLKREPTTQQAGIGLAIALLYQGKKQAALDAARSILEYRQEDGSVWNVIAYMERALGHGDAAKDAYERAVRFEPWNTNAYAGLVMLARQRNDWNSAVAAQREIVRLTPKDIGAWIELAGFYIASGRGERALNSAEKALELASSNGDALIMKGGALYSLNRLQEATEALRSGITHKPLRPVVGWAWLADIYYGLHLYPEAIESYREALKIDSKNSSLRGKLGVALKDNLQLDEALALFKQLQAENPKDPFTWRQIGYVYAYQAQPEKAIPAYEQSLNLEATQSKVWRALMEAYHTAGRKDDVKRAYQKLQAIDQSWSEQAYKSLLLPYEVTP